MTLEEGLPATCMETGAVPNSEYDRQLGQYSVCNSRYVFNTRKKKIHRWLKEA